MNLLRTYLIAILLLAFGIGANGQEPPKAVLVDEFGKPDCETLWSRLDLLASEMKKRPDTIATIDISGESKDPHVAFYWDSMIRGYFVRYKFPKGQWTVRRGILAEEWRIQFWLSPPRAPQPEFKESEWRMTYSSETKPFVFTNGDSYSVEVGVCLYVDEIALLAKALEHNPDARVNAVLVVRSEREFIRRKQTVIKQLANDYAIKRTRIRIFKKLTAKPNPYGISPTTEYWLLP